MRRNAGITILLFCVLSMSNIILAQQIQGADYWTAQPDIEQAAQERFSAGLGVIVNSKPYKGFDEDVFLIPLIMYKKGNFYSRGRNIGYTFTEGDMALASRDLHWSLDAIAEVRFDGYDSDDAYALNGMDDRDWTIEAGLSTRIEDKDLGFVEFDWLMDILSRHEGHRLRLTYGKAFTINKKLTLTPTVGFTWQSSDLVDYYYGVRSNETRADRPAYSADSTVNWFTALQSMYRLDEHWSLFSLFGWEFLGGEIKDSPIVDDDSTLSGIFGVLYTF